MPTLNIEGVGPVTVDDTFLALPPDEQEAAVEEIVASLGGGGAQAQQPKPRGSFMDAAVGQGLMMGWGDEAKAALHAALPDMGAPDDAGLRQFLGKPEETFGERYSRMQAVEQGKAEDYRERHPVLSAAGEIGGALTGALASGGASLLPRATTTLGKLGMAGAAGAGAGAVYGSGTADPGLENRIEGGLTGSLIGAPAGVAGQAIVSAARPVMQGARAVGRGLSRTMDSPQRRAVRMVNESLEADAVTPQQVAARMRRSQADANAPNLTLMDVADQNTLGRAASAAASPGPGRQTLNSALDRRAAGGPRRVQAAASQALGDPNTFRQTGQQLAQQRAANGKQLYEAAYQAATPVDVSGVLREIETRIPAAKGTIQGTLVRIRNLLTRDGAPEADLRSLHEAKLELDEMLSSGGDRSLGRVTRGEVAKVRRQLLDAMDRSNPAYGAARRVYADESALMNALETGRRFLREDVDDLADMMATMGSAERQMFQQGAVREIRGIIENAPDGADVVKRIFGSEAKRKALKAVFPNEREFRQFQATMMREATGRRTRDIVHVRRGSRTEVLRGDNDASSAASEFLGGVADVGLAAATGGLTAASVGNRTSNAFAKMLQKRNNMSPDVAREVARIMIEENPNEVLRLLSMGPQAARALPPPPAGIGRGVVPFAAGSVAALQPR